MKQVSRAITIVVCCVLVASCAQLSTSSPAVAPAHTPQPLALAPPTKLMLVVDSATARILPNINAINFLQNLVNNEIFGTRCQFSESGIALVSQPAVPYSQWRAEGWSIPQPLKILLVLRLTRPETVMMCEVGGNRADLERALVSLIALGIPDQTPLSEIPQLPVASVFLNRNLQEMLVGSASNNDQAIDAGLQAVRSLVKPDRGDRAAARKLNTEGLAKFNTAIYGEAMELFNRARQLDKSDVEIVNNYAYAALKHGSLTVVIPALEQALLITPDRTAAWGNLYQVLAMQAATEISIRGAMALVLRFSKNQERTHQFIRQQIASEPDKAVQARLQSAYGPFGVP